MRRFAQAIVAMTAIFGFANLATAQGNSPEVQRALEVAAATMKGQDDGVVKVSETIIGDRSLVIRYQPSAGVKRTKAGAKFKQLANMKAGQLCSADSLPDFLRRTGTKIIMEFEREPNVYEVEKQVTAAFCDGAAAVRMIDGKPLYPKPAHDTAIQTILDYLKQTLFDYDSAKVNCSQMTPAVWMKFPLQSRRYGYLIECDINAKNRFGGYVGFQPHRYYFNGNVFEEITDEPAVGFVD